MANILQVTTPSVNTDNRTITNNQDARNTAENPRIHNPADPTRVVRADGQENGKTGTASDEGAYRVIDYESNYGAFIGKLGEGMELTQLLDSLMFGGLIQLTGQEAVGDLMEQLLSSIQINSPEELLAYVKGQEAVQTKFSGAFFDGLRASLSKNPSDHLADAAALFLKSCNDYFSGGHLLNQMRSLADDISRLMLKSYRDEYQELLNTINWNAANGDTGSNKEVLNNLLFPFLSSYISKTHDYGAVRDAVMLLMLHAVSYENGSEDQLWQMFDRLVESREFERNYKGNAQEDFKSFMSAMEQQSPSKELADTLTALLLKGAGGQAGLEHIQQFYSILNGMLLNESVYMPLLHILVPFQYRDQEVMSEIWADPDAGKEQEDGSRKVKMFLKFDIQNVGKFDMILALQDRRVEMQLYVPPVLAHSAEQIQEHIGGILKKNGLGFQRLLVRERQIDIGVEAVFPEIMERGRTINVRI